MRTRKNTNIDKIPAEMKKENVISNIKSNKFSEMKHTKTLNMLHNLKINNTKNESLKEIDKQLKSRQRKYYLQRHNIKDNTSISDYNRYRNHRLNKSDFHKSNVKGIHKSNEKGVYRHPLLQNNVKHQKGKSRAELKETYLSLIHI